MERTQLIMSKRKFRFNIIDALIILLVLAAVGVIGKTGTGGSEAG